MSKQQATVNAKKLTQEKTEEIPHLRSFQTEWVDLDTLHPHPRNYQTHPDDELEHIIESIRTHGFYRNIVIAQDGTILAGHGVVEAIRRLGHTHIPAIRLPYAYNDPHALKLLIGDNEIRHLATVDDRILTELLKELVDIDSSELLGTGYDEMMLANLLMTTRPASEIADLDAAAQWVGMPEYDMGQDSLQVIVHFVNEEDRLEFYRRLDLDTIQAAKQKSIWWPKSREDDDNISIRFVSQAAMDNKDDE